MGHRNCDLFQAGDIACIIGDDSDHGSGSVQYSGLWTLVSRHKIHTAIAPPYAGLLAGAHRGTMPIFTRIDNHSARLQKTGDAMESEATFTLSPPHYIDYHFSFALKKPWTPGALGDFMEQSWCNYMNGLPDPAIYFISGGKWVREFSTIHGYKSMYYPSGLPDEDREERPVDDYEARGLPVPFHWTQSETTFDLPLYYGQVYSMMYLVMFDQFRNWRFFMSPTGGGGNALGPGHHNPAWDWSWM